MSLSSCVNKVLNNNADSLIKKRVKINLGDLEKGFIQIVSGLGLF